MILWLIPVVLFGCDDGDDEYIELIGKWRLESINGKSLETIKGLDIFDLITVNCWEFQPDGVLIQRFGFHTYLEYPETGSDAEPVEVEGGVRLTWAYCTLGSTYTAKLKEAESTGTFKEGILEGFDPIGREVVGKWSVEGDLLTFVNVMPDEVVVLKRKTVT